ncbi:MAG: hypothetical protein QOC73_2155, partial [Actinomycetota bacterium]|nr:hypothetical protein [Actinomycetota bacterium]
MSPTLELTDRTPSDVEALVVALTPGDDAAVLDARARADVEAFGADADGLLAVVARDKVKGNAGDIVVLPFGSRIVLAAGVGGGTPRDLRRAGAAI